MANNNVKFEWNKSVEQIKKDAGLSKQTHLFAASESVKLMDPFVPFDDGYLSQEYTVDADEEKGEITYNKDYAKTVFNNKRGVVFKTTHHPLATDKWHDAMVASKGGTLVNSVANYMKKTSK